MKIVNLHAAKTHLSRLVEEAAAGNDIVIAKAGRPRARLVAIAQMDRRRRPGALRGKIHIGRDFDAPLPPDLGRAFGTDE